MTLAALMNSTDEFLGLIYIIIMVVLGVFAFVPPASPYARFALLPIFVCLAIIGWVLFGPGGSLR
jgi:hypothetical protein